MAEIFDYIVIGGGVMGASIAYHLSQQKAGRVLLLERQALCSGTTARSGAIVRQHYSNDFSIRMAKESLHIFQHFDEAIGGDCGFTTTGMLVVSDKQGEETLRANVALQQEQGVNTRLIAPNEIAEVAPEYSGDGATLACYEADAGVASKATPANDASRSAQARSRRIIAPSWARETARGCPSSSATRGSRARSGRGRRASAGRTAHGDCSRTCPTPTRWSPPARASAASDRACRD